MDPGHRSPLVDLFRRGEATADARLLAARGLLAPTTQDQLALLMLLSDDRDPEIAAQANATLDRLPVDALAAYLAGADVPAAMREFFAARRPPAPPADPPAAQTAGDAAKAAETDDVDEKADPRILAGLPVGQRLKYAMKGTREQRAQLIRDSNKIVATAVLSSPKLTEAEVEAFVKMGNVSEDVLRIIGTNRGWLKNYNVVLGLTRNPKTPPALSMLMMNRLTEKDVKMLTVDRNVPEALRLAARRLLVKSKHG
jgi:ribosomal protein L12E/L44/L45/RPP1/RPP2